MRGSIEKRGRISQPSTFPAAESVTLTLILSLKGEETDVRLRQRSYGTGSLTGKIEMGAVRSTVWLYPGGGATPSCCIMDIMSATAQWSRILPSTNPQMSIMSNLTLLPVAGTPNSSPVCVPSKVL